MDADGEPKCLDRDHVDLLLVTVLTLVGAPHGRIRGSPEASYVGATELRVSRSRDQWRERMRDEPRRRTMRGCNPPMPWSGRRTTGRRTPASSSCALAGCGSTAPATRGTF